MHVSIVIFGHVPSVYIQVDAINHWNSGKGVMMVEKLIVMVVEEEEVILVFVMVVVEVSRSCDSSDSEGGIDVERRKEYNNVIM